jgi:hypothetical protein
MFYCYARIFKSLQLRARKRINALNSQQTALEGTTNALTTHVGTQMTNDAHRSLLGVVNAANDGVCVRVHNERTHAHRWWQSTPVGDTTAT